MSRIEHRGGRLEVPDAPVIPFIEGDGTGPDIWRAAVLVLDEAVRQAYGGKRRIQWLQVLAGEAAYEKTGSWLPDETVAAIHEHMVAIKGPLTTPVGGGIRSLNVALRLKLDLYVCLRPVKYYAGVPSPVRHPERVDMVVFRENTEDVYAGMELQASTPDAAALAQFLGEHWGWKIGEDTGIGIKPVSRRGSERLIRAAIEYAILHERNSVTLVHKGNIQKFTEGAFCAWGYDLARREYPEKTVSYADCGGQRPAGRVMVQDVIADICFQQVLTRPENFDVIATTNLNGDYLSDALAAQVGGIGIAPGANINYTSGHALFEATHGTAPKYANKNVVNPSSVILSGMMMLEYLGWAEAARLIDRGMSGAISGRRVTYDFARLMDDAQQVSTTEFAECIVRSMA
jgi:isocitrate dehydrogenase